MRFAVDANARRVCIDDVEKGQTFYCQECGEKLVQRRGEIKAHHFAHYPNTKCVDNWQYDESEWHYLMQSLFPNDCQEIVMELDGKKHRADVFIKDRQLVVEFQGDRIRQTEFSKRNEFFRKLGYKVVWLFDESIPFENESIDNYELNKGCMRGWSRSSKTFEDFHPEENKDIEIWFSKKRECEDDEPNFFQVLSDDKFRSFKIIECGHCYTKNELIEYLSKGVITIDRSALFDVHRAIRRTDGYDYFYACPKTDNHFTSVDECYGCKFCEKYDDNEDPHIVECSGRCRKIDLKNINKIQSIDRNLDGFIETINGVTEDGEVIKISLNTPSSSLRTMTQLWEKYKPLKYLFCYNVKTKRTFKVFNPAWQKAKTGVIKGYLHYRGSSRGGEMEIYGADEPVWIVTYFIKNT